MVLEHILRGWMSTTVLLTLGNIFQARNRDLLCQKLFDVSGRFEVSPGYCRLFIHYNMFLIMLRLAYIYESKNKMLFRLNVLAYVHTLLYYGSEVVLYRSATFNFAIIVNIIVACFSLLLMSCAYCFLWDSTEDELADHLRRRNVSNLTGRHRYMDKTEEFNAHFVPFPTRNLPSKFE